jgi:hypothetical protein
MAPWGACIWHTGVALKRTGLMSSAWGTDYNLTISTLRLCSPSNSIHHIRGFQSEVLPFYTPIFFRIEGFGPTAS